MSRQQSVLPVEFRMEVFRPFKGEVVIARIRSQTQDGINRRFWFSEPYLTPGPV